MRSFPYFFAVLVLATGMQSCHFNYLESKDSDRYGITAYVDPAYHSQTFDGIAVYSDSSDLNWRRTIETKTLETLQKNGVRAFSGSRMVPPTRQWTRAEGDSILRQAGVNAVLLFDVEVDSTSSEVFVPLTTSSKTREENKRTQSGAQTDSTGAAQKGSSGKGVREEWTVVEQKGGYMKTEITRNYRISARLVDVRNGAVAWVGHYTTNKDNYMNDFTWRVANQLIMDDLVVRRVKQD